MHLSPTTKIEEEKKFHFPEVFHVYIDHSFLFPLSIPLESRLNAKLLNKISVF